MAVRGIVGDIGCGKTLLMTYLGYVCYKGGYTIYANYDLNFPYIPIDKIRDLDELSTKQNLILLDEAWITADSRKSSTYTNIMLSRSVLQSRKNKADLIYTTQFVNQIDIRIRQITHQFLIPKIVYWTTEDIPAIIKATFYESVGSGKFRELGSKIFDIYNTHQLYNTNEIIKETRTEEYVDLLTKYKGFEGNKGELKAVLSFEDNLSPSQAGLVASYIMFKNEYGRMPEVDAEEDEEYKDNPDISSARIYWGKINNNK
jgi:hypothetical protein